MKENLLVSVSGGRTSGLMAWLINQKYKDKYNILYVFANTSREKEETLLFVRNIGIRFNIPIVWVEAEVHHGVKKGCTHKVVSYETAARDGSTFENVIIKYGIPNSAFLHCTRELKTNPIQSYLKSQGWGNYKKYITAIGYRKDEPKRINLIRANDKKQWYPLFEWGITKADVAAFWKKQSFDLGLADFEGNCKLCYKKSDRKIITQSKIDPGTKEWIERMEKAYSDHSAGRKGVLPPYTFFRHNRTLQEVLNSEEEGFVPAVDQAMKTEGATYDYDLDEQEDCAESSEPF